MKSEFVIGNISRAIPFDLIVEAMHKMEYGSSIRVMFGMAFLTGCRLRELEHMKAEMIYDTKIRFPLGKNQKGWRVVELPPEYLKELAYYRQNKRVYGNKLFGASAMTFRRLFNREIRPRLSSQWHLKIDNNRAWLNGEYVYQLKGLRKNYQTLLFAKNLDKWNSAEVAMLFTSKEMKHSSHGITAYHYLENFEALQVEKYKKFTIDQILRGESDQRRIFEFE